MYQARRTSDASVVVNEDNDGSISCFEMDDTQLSAKAITSKISTPTLDDKPMVNLDGYGSYSCFDASPCFEMDDASGSFSKRRDRLKFSQRPTTTETPVGRRSSLGNDILQTRPNTTETPTGRRSSLGNDALQSRSCYRLKFSQTPSLKFSTRPITTKTPTGRSSGNGNGNGILQSRRCGRLNFSQTPSLKFLDRPKITVTRRRSSLDHGILRNASTPKTCCGRKLPDGPVVVSLDGSASSCIEMDVPMTPRWMRFSNKANKPKESKRPASASQVKPFMVNFEALEDSLSCFELLDESVAAAVRSPVTFNTSAEEHLILHLNDLSSEEKQSIWYQEQELNDIMEAIGETLRLRRKKGGLLDLEEHCLQGLGPQTKKGDKERRSRWLLSLTCVLDEQKRQAKDGIKDPVKIAQLYQSLSKASEKIAIVSAERTAREQYMRERSIARMETEQQTAWNPHSSTKADSPTQLVVLS